MFKREFKLFSFLLVVLFVFAGVTGALAAPKGEVVVTLSAGQTAFASSENVVIHVVIENQSKNPVKILKWYTPAEDVEEPLFAISRNGEAVKYVGALYKRPAATGKDYIVLKSGESLARDVDLGAYYDLATTGEYVISYDVAAWNLFSEKASDSTAVESLSSNALTLNIQGRASLDKAPQPEAITGSTTFNKCTTTQQSTIITARNEATTYAANAQSYLNANANNQPTQRYTTWFGSYLASRYNTVTSNFGALNNTLSTASMKFDCGCKKPYYAYVYPDRPYTVYLCKVFWSAPMTGTDSKAGTIIHETSHFYVVIGTEDWVYGQTGAKNLAITDPAKAINNADNHEYFAENTPYLP